MAAETVPYGRSTQQEPAVSEVHIVWMTAGLGCDGDSVSITAATQPSIEDVLLGAIPGLPKVHLHNPVLAYENGDDFLKYWYMAEEGSSSPSFWSWRARFPNEKIKKEGYWAALGTDPTTNQPITTNEWIDRLAPKATAVIACGTCATYGGIHAMEGNPTGCMGLADYLGWNWTFEGWTAHRECPGMPGAARQLHGDGALSALSSRWTRSHDSAGRSTAARPGCSERRFTKDAIAPATTSRVISPRCTVPRSAS